MMTNEKPAMKLQKTFMSRDTAVMSKKKRKKPSQHSVILSVRQLRMRITSDDPMYLGLKKIKISGKELSNLPTNLFNLTELQVLDLSPEREACLFYHMTSIPDEISNLHNLTILAIDTNRLTSLPESLCDLAHLERLALSNNHLTDLPQGFSKLTSLRSLYCANNQFQEIPIQLTDLTDLVFLDFSDNQITLIPEEIGNMAELQSLILSYNNISWLPESICRLSNLEILWLSGNQLTTLPKGLSNLSRLDWNWLSSSSAIDNNPLEHPPMSIAKQGPASIDRYLSLHQSNRTSQTDYIQSQAHSNKLQNSRNYMK